MKKIAVLFICFLLLWACATDRTAVTKAPGEPAHSVEVTADRPPSAEELLAEAATAISLPDGSPADNHLKAREILNHLLQSYPDSKWRNPAEAMILLIDRQTACAEKSKRDRQLCDSVTAQRLRCEESENQCRQELTRILQENEQLKQDLQNLKNLEIELEQRNRGIR